jgi:hypothetical protein
MGRFDMSNDDVNAVVLRLARTLQRCGEDPGVVFAALIGAAATLASDIGLKDDSPEELARAMGSIVAHGDLRGVRPAARPAGADVIPFRPARVA